MKKLNCWEIKQCGNQDKCMASTDSSCNGINGGSNAGRICWALPGTLCNGKIQGDFAQKSVSCMSCEVFQRIKNEEGADDFILLKPGQVYQTSLK